MTGDTMHTMHEHVEYAILDLFDEQEDKYEYVSVERVLARLGMENSAKLREEVAGMMTRAATWNGWKRSETLGLTVSVLPRTDI
jgi:hypothetical protein